MLFCSLLKDRFQNWVRDYDRLQYLAIILIYIQIGCALIGALGALYNGVLLIHLAISLFALVAIESSSQSLGRTYAVLLFCSLFIDISWFILFTHDIWNISSSTYGPLFIFSVKLALAMQIVGFSVRLSSSFLWIQIYRLGASSPPSGQPDFDLPNSFLSPTTTLARQNSASDLVLGGSIYDPQYYSSLFEDAQGNRALHLDQNSVINDNGSTSGAEASQLKMSAANNFFQVIDVSISPTTHLLLVRLFDHILASIAC